MGAGDATGVAAAWFAMRAGLHPTETLIVAGLASLLVRHLRRTGS